MDREELEQAARLADFFHLYRADRARGRPRELMEYQTLFPGIAELVRREYDALGSRRLREVDHVGTQPRLPGYRIVRELGQGGQGVVYLAEDIELRRLVALKVLPSSLGALSDARLARMRREVGLLVRLDHPGICSVYRAHLDHEPPFVAMRYVKGLTLAQVLECANKTEAPDPHSASVIPLRCIPRTPRDIERMLRFFESAGQALHAAHEAGIVHRDVKPPNIVADGEGRPVLLDFGLARALDGHESVVTMSGELFGTPVYMSPEQLDLPSEELDRRTDVYSLGVTLFECLTGHRPFDAPSQHRLALAIRHEPVPRVTRLNRELPPDLDVVVATALEKDRARRYATALALAEELQRVRERKPVLARPTGAFLRVRRWSQRNPGGATALALSLVGALGFAIALARLVHETEQTRVALRVAESRNLAASALATIALDPLEGLRQALKSDELAPGLHSRTALYAALQAQHIEREFAFEKPLPMRLAPDRETLVIPTVEQGISLHQLSTGDTTLLGDLRAEPSAIEATAGGRIVAVGGVDGSLVVFHREPAPRQRSLPSRSSRVHALAISPDSRLLASAAHDARIRLDALDGDGAGRELTLTAGAVGGLCFSPRGEWLLAWPAEQIGDPPLVEFTPQLFYSADGVCVARLTGHRSSIDEARFAPGGNAVATASDDCTVRIWDLPAGTERLRLQHPAKVHDVRFSPDGRFLATACDPGDPGESDGIGVRVFDATKGTLVLGVAGHEARAVAAVDWSADGRSLLSASYDGTARVWDVADGRETFCLRTSAVLTDALFAADGSRIFAQAGKLGFVAHIRGPGPPMRITGHRAAVMHAAFSGDGGRLVTADADGLALVHDVSNGALLAELDAGRSGLRRVCFVGEHVLAASADGSCLEFDVASARCLRRFELGTEPVRCLQALPGDREFVLTVGARAVRLDPASGRRIEFVGHAGEVSCIAVSADGRYLATGARDRTARLWDLGSGELRAHFDEWERANSLPSADGVFALAFSLRGERLLVATDDNALRCYSVPDGALSWSVPGHMRVGGIAWLDEDRFLWSGQWRGCAAIEDRNGFTELFPSPRGRPMSLSVDADRSRALIAATSGQTQLWDLREASLFASLAGHQGAILFTEFSPDGTCFVTTAADGTAQLWPVDPAASARERLPEIVRMDER